MSDPSKNEGFLNQWGMDQDLLRAAASRDCDKVVSLLKDGANPNVKNEDGNTPLHLALYLPCTDPSSKQRCERCCSVLLSAPGINVNIVNKQGRTPLQLAAVNKLEQCVNGLASQAAHVSSEGDGYPKAGSETSDFEISPERDYRNRGKIMVHMTMDLLEAAACRDPDKMLDLLEEGADPNMQDSNGDTPLHVVLNSCCSCKICNANAESCCAVLLNAPKIDVNVQNKNGEAPMHLAAFNQLEQCVQDLIFKGAGYYLCTNDGMTALSVIASRTPNVMIKILDESISTDNINHKSVDCIAKVDLQPLILSKQPSHIEASLKYQEEEVISTELNLLNSLLSSDLESQKKLFLHPVVGIFLHEKWRRGRIPLITTVIIRLIWLLCFTSYVVCVYVLMCPCVSYGTLDPRNGSMTQTENASALTISSSEINAEEKNLTKEELDCLRASQVDVGFILICVLTVARMCYNLMEMCISKTHVRDVFHVIIMIMVLGTFYPTFARQTHIPGLQYQYASLTVFLAWSMNMTLFGKFRNIGGYFEMYAQVLRRFVSIIPTFFFLYVAFALAFCVLFPNKNFFSQFHLSIIRVLIMTMGTDYENLFYGSDLKLQPGEPIVGHLLYAAFVMLIILLLLNLMIGLTVSDIQTLQNQAEMRLVTVQIRDMYNMECMVYSRKLPAVIRNFFWKYLSVAPTLARGPRGQLYFYLKINDPTDRAVSDDIKGAAASILDRVHNERRALVCEQMSYYTVDRSKNRFPNASRGSKAFQKL